jgi:hypothetical protein
LVALILGQSWLVFYDDFTVVDIDECLKICYALYALDSYEINLISLDKFFSNSTRLLYIYCFENAIGLKLKCLGEKIEESWECL